MNNTFTLTVRVFPLTIRDGRSGEISESTVILTKEQLRAAQLLGQSSNELLTRMCRRQGYTILRVGKPVKKTLSVDLYTHVKSYGGA